MGSTAESGLCVTASKGEKILERTLLTTRNSLAIAIANNYTWYVEKANENNHTGHAEKNT